jgi:N-acetyl-gamma-glutamyl-phosphate reductase
MIWASVVGATGYVGEELVRLLGSHPHVGISCLTSQNHAGDYIQSLFPNLNGKVDMRCEEMNIFRIAEVSDIVFLSMPHGHSICCAREVLSQGKKVIDMGADFRFDSYEAYEKWYSVEHTGKDMLENAIYGLTEINNEKIKDANLVGNPGCFPTSIILGLAPVLTNRIVDPRSIIVDSKSGISGAGKSANTSNLFTEISGNVKPYNIAKHRHVPEINQELSKILGSEVSITFSPHVVPMSRGILSTIYCNLDANINADEILNMYKEYYKDKRFVKIMDKGVYPQVKWVYGSNYCHIGVEIDSVNNRLVIVSALDNLVKGAAGQAVQNMNLMYGFPEETGLEAAGLYI